MNIDTYSPEEIERYRIDHPGEIERILSSVMARKALVTAYSDNSRDFLVTSLVAIDKEEGAVYFGAAEDESLNEALVASQQVSFNTAHEQVRVLFTTPGLALATMNGERLLRGRMPGELLRFQRREYYRLPTSVTRPVQCLITVGERSLETRVVDISIGGIGVLAYSADVALRQGETYRDCRLTLPGAGTYQLSLRVQALFETTVRNGVECRRAGCQFIDLAPSVETDIQRYIIRAERERRTSLL